MIAIMSAWPSLFDDAPVRRFGAGHVLFQRGDPVRSLFLVKSGAIVLERPKADGTALTLHVAEEGTLLAEASLFADAYHCNAFVRTPSQVGRLPKRVVLAALRASPDMALDLLAGSARLVQAQRTRIEILRLRRVSDRLDAWLDLHGEPARGEWIRVADAIGVTPPALYRELARRRLRGARLAPVPCDREVGGDDPTQVSARPG